MIESPILKSKFYLYLTEFFSGVSVMAVELGASRLLAPYFSSSQVVWTIIIGTIMIAMALGNLWGGRSADKDPNPDRLYLRILISSIWIAAIPLVGKYVILSISGLLTLTVSTNLLVFASFLSCMVIFVYPLFLLGTVTPSLVKYTMDSLDDSGRTVGTLGAANTIGSIIGTFLPTFVTIPTVGTSITFLIFSCVLLVIALVYFLSSGKRRTACVISIILFLICSFFGYSSSFAFWEHDLRYEGESIYNYLQVKEWDDRIVLSTNVLFGVQSVKMKENGLTEMYYDYALAGPVMANLSQKKDGSVLVLGNGTGTYATQCKMYFPDAAVTGVEIDAKITDLANKYFSLPEDVKVITYDGRAYLQAVDTRYDVIFVDAYQDITIPFQMSSVEFFTLVKEHLNPDGVLVVNLNLTTNAENGINDALCDTIASVFGSICMVDMLENDNRELFASNDADLPVALDKNLIRLEDRDLRRMMRKISDNLAIYKAGNRMLTDDRAPVEVLGMKMLDAYISKELSIYKDVFRRKGFAGLLQELNVS